MKIQLAHQCLQEITIIAADKIIAQCNNCTELVVDPDPGTGTKITVQFRPYGIKPLLRIDGFLIDYWIGGILQQDHQIEFDLQQDFIDRYRDRDRQGRLDSLSDKHREVDHYLDKYIGIDNLYPDLLTEIRDLLDEKSNIRQSP